ncbi:MAG TPA: GNAT family N-acetyltransferase [Novosphingobium sp.]|nr:GNAT family N-acetyltransferase [Novosphingobium sp.]
MKLELRPCAGEAELSDPAVTGAFAEQMAALSAQAQVPPWCGYIGWQGNLPLGFGGFVGEPDGDGVIEIGYLTFPAHEGRGVASAVAAEMIAIARAQGLAAVIAHTLPQENASTGVLRRNGFARDGEAQDPDEGTVWRWRLHLR